MITNTCTGVPIMAQWLTNQTRIMRLQIQSLVSLSGLMIWCCHELWCKSKMWLGSGIAVALAQAGGYSSDLTPSLGTSICHGCSPRKDKKKKILVRNLERTRYCIKIMIPGSSALHGRMQQKDILRHPQDVSLNIPFLKIITYHHIQDN